MRVLSVSLSLLVSFYCFSSSANAASDSIDHLVNQFFVAQSVSKSSPKSTSRQFSLSRDPRCDDGPSRPAGGCVDVVCKKLGPFGCDDISEMERVANMCRGNFDGRCVESVCSQLGSFGCDDLSEVEHVTMVCRGGHGGCIDTVCKRLGRFGCDDMSEIEQVARTCQGNFDGSCIESVCKKLGPFGCDDLSEIERVARSCSGTR
jgi:hypothetical protein